jgi:succinate dehydrogenase hydrophobic anchor subunit
VQRDDRFFIVGVIIGGVLFMFYDIFQIGIFPLIIPHALSESTAQIWTKVIAIGVSIIVILLFYYIGIKHILQDKEHRSLWDKFWNGSE